MDDMDDDDDQPSKKKWKANSPNMKLKRKTANHGKKQTVSAMNKNKKKSTSSRLGKARRMAKRNRR